jgi:hypothetical protein
MLQIFTAMLDMTLISLSAQRASQLGDYDLFLGRRADIYIYGN